MEFKNQRIKCSIFWDTEIVIKKADTKMKEAKSYKERQYYAQDILLESKTLLSCSNYNDRNPDCLNCHAVSREHLREYECFGKDTRGKVIIKG